MATSGRELRSARGEAARPTRKHAPGRVVLVLTLLLILAGCRPIPDPSAVATPLPAQEQPPEEQAVEEQPTAEEPVTEEPVEKVSRAERLLQEGAPELLWTYQPDEPEVDSDGMPLSLARALIGETVYVGAANGYVHALHADSGELLWSFQAGGNVYKKASPVQIGGSVFFGSEDGNLYALDAASGALLWQHSSDVAILRVMAADGVLYFAAEDRITYALNPVSGEELWRSRIENDLPLLSAVSGSVVYAVTANTLYALDAANGELLWVYAADDTVWHKLAVSETFYFNTGGELFALDAATGQETWSVSTDDLVSGRPMIFDGVFYFSLIGGSAHALELETGEELWRFDIGMFPSLSPTVIDGVLYGRSMDGTVIAIDAKTGVPLWGGGAGRGSDSLPVAEEGVVYLKTYRGLVGAVDAMTGELLWRFQTEDGAIASLMADEGVFYIFQDDGAVIALLPRIERESEWGEREIERGALSVATHQAEALGRRAAVGRGREEERQRGDLLRLLEPLAVRDGRFVRCGNGGHGCIHRPRNQLVDADVVAAQLLAEDTRKHPQSGFGNTVGR